MRFLFALILCALLCGCDIKSVFSPEAIFPGDLELAKHAYSRRDWPLAERLLGRCLREEQDPEKRWQAWNLLLQALNATSPEPRASLECLDVMLVEYEDDDLKLAGVLAQMGEYNESLHHYDRAANAWSAYTDLETLPIEERARGLRRLAQAQLGQRHFDAAEESLQQCLALPLEDSDKVWCMLDLAEVGARREQWQDVADLCQQILDSAPDSQASGLAAYLRGDALEQMGENFRALAQFEQGRDQYPNPAVMDNRIAWLKKQLKAKDK